MQKLSILLFMVLLCTTQVFSQKTETRQLTSFSKVSVHEAINAILTKGTTESAKVEATGVELSEVLTEVSGGELKIHMEDGNYKSRNVTVYVTFKYLDELNASSAGSIEVKDPLTVNGDFDVSASSAGSVRVEATASGDTDLDVSSSGDIDIILKSSSIDAGLSSSGDITISGSCNELEVDASSAGDFNGYDLVTKVADLEGSSGASIKVNVTDQLDAQASSGASIRYLGSPKNTNSDSSSGGSVRKSD